VSIKPTIACDCPVLPLPVLIREHIRVDAVFLGEIDHFEAGVLTVNAAELIEAGPEVIAVRVDVIPPGERTIACDTVLDFFPVAVKADGVVGSGLTRIADGVVMMVTATEADGTQAGEFGDSHGILSERIDSSACGVPDDDVWIVRVAVTLRDGVAKIRSGPHAAHLAADTVAQRLRTTLLAAPVEAVTRRDQLEEPRRSGGLRVVYAKMVMGQGAMHEKLLLPAEPYGVRGGRSIIDLGQGPVMLRVNEVVRSLPGSRSALQLGECERCEGCGAGGVQSTQAGLHADFHEYAATQVHHDPQLRLIRRPSADRINLSPGRTHRLARTWGKEREAYRLALITQPTAARPWLIRGMNALAVAQS
jgi:hypothetical protein